MGSKINIENINSFIQGSSRHLLDRFNALEDHIVEQVAYRESKCPECKTAGHCLGSCKCSVPGRWFSTKTCNNGEKFPDLMTKVKWDEYKKEHNITL